MKKIMFMIISIMVALLFLASCDGSAVNTTVPSDEDRVSSDAPAETPTETPEPHVHDHILQEETAPTCTEDGLKIYTCQCGDSYTEAVSSLGEHQWGELSVKKEPTYTEEGRETVECVRCGEIKESNALKKKSLKILFIGNSFAVDTTNLAPKIAKALGVEEMRFGTLYIAGCSINKHYTNIVSQKTSYTYYVSDGGDWSTLQNYSIQMALKETDWDYICIQHGTGDGSRYTKELSYTRLGSLVERIKEVANEGAKIAFNMAWVMEPDSTHAEMVSYGGNQLLMYEKLTEVTELHVATVEGIDIVVPTGTTIQNARTVINKVLTRDKFHLSKDVGRFMAAMTLLEAMCGIDTDELGWRTTGVTDSDLAIAKQAINAAVSDPYNITDLKEANN